MVKNTVSRTLIRHKHTTMKPLSQAPADFNKVEEALRQTLVDAPTIIGVEALAAVHDNFQREAFLGDTQSDLWAKRRNPLDQAAPILRRRGHLYDSITFRVQGDTVFLYVNLLQVPYAKIHNEGGKIPVTPKMRKYFWRQFKSTQEPFWSYMARASVITIPARKFLDVTEGTLNRCQVAIWQHFDKLLNQP